MQEHENVIDASDQERPDPSDFGKDPEAELSGKISKWQTPADLRAASNISRQIDALQDEQKNFVLDYVKKRYGL